LRQNLLNAFGERGLVRKVPYGDGNYFYDTNDSDHIHLITESREGSRTIVDADNLDCVIEDLKRIAEDGEAGLVIQIIQIVL
jgi:Fe2+ or Zn2+ uptake regulation protein